MLSLPLAIVKVGCVPRTTLPTGAQSGLLQTVRGTHPTPLEYSEIHLKLYILSGAQ